MKFMVDVVGVGFSYLLTVIAPNAIDAKTAAVNTVVFERSLSVIDRALLTVGVTELFEN